MSESAAEMPVPADAPAVPAPPAGKAAEPDVVAPFDWPGFLWFIFWFATAVLSLRVLFISPYNIPSESMQPRLLIGDYLMVNKMAYGWSRYSVPVPLPLPAGRIMGRLPERGDVVVFKAPPDHRDDYIKRVIGLPGDTIQMVDGVLQINGVAVRREQIDDLVIPVTPNMVEASYGNPCFRPVFEMRARNGALYCRYPRFRETLPGGHSYTTLDLVYGEADTTGVYQVPEGHLFLMGDNRDRSFDSRFPAVRDAGIGMVPMDNIEGEAWFLFLSVDGSATWYNPASWFAAIRWNRIGTGF